MPDTFKIGDWVEPKDTPLPSRIVSISANVCTTQDGKSYPQEALRLAPFIAHFVRQAQKPEEPDEAFDETAKSVLNQWLRDTLGPDYEIVEANKEWRTTFVTGRPLCYLAYWFRGNPANMETEHE